MAESTTPRMGMKKSSTGTNPWPGRAGWMQMLQNIEDRTAKFAQGTFAQRPAAGEKGRFFLVESANNDDYDYLYYDDGFHWLAVAKFGASDDPLQQTQRLGYMDGANGNPGGSPYAARADHTHPYCFGYTRNRLALQWGETVGPGAFDGAADQQYRIMVGMQTDGMDERLLTIKRAGVYKVTAAVHMEGFSEANSPWKTNTILLTIRKNGSEPEHVIAASPVPGIQMPAVRNVREHQFTAYVQLAVDDYISAGFLLSANVATSSGVLTNGFKYISAEMV